MKVIIDCDEQYPTYSVDECRLPSGTECEVPTRKVKRWRLLEKAYRKMQKEMADYIKIAEGKQL